MAPSKELEGVLEELQKAASAEEEKKKAAEIDQVMHMQMESHRTALANTFDEIMNGPRAKEE